MGYENPWLAGALGAGVSGMLAQVKADSQQHSAALSALMNQQARSAYALPPMSYAEMNDRIMGAGGMGALLREPEIPSAMDDWDADFLLQTGKEVRHLLMEPEELEDNNAPQGAD